MKIKPDNVQLLYIFYICFAFIFVGSAVVLTTIINLQPALSQGYIPPPLTTSTNQNSQIANNNNNNNPSTANTIGSSSSGQSQLNQGQQQQPNSNCNTKLMVGCGSINPSNTTTTPTKENLGYCYNQFSVSCIHLGTCPPGVESIAPCTPTTSDLCASGALYGSACNGNNTTSGPGSTMQKERMCDPAACTPQQQPDSNCNTISMVGCGSINPNNTTSTNQPFTTLNPNTNPGAGTANQLVNPNAFNYQTNPEKRFVDISKDPTQKINSLVTNSFGQGVPNLSVSIQVKDPTGNTAALFTGKTDNDGKNVVSFPVKTAGTWTALVAISSSAATGGILFSDQISWNAVSRSIPNLVCSTGPHPNCHVE